MIPGGRRQIPRQAHDSGRGRTLMARSFGRHSSRLGRLIAAAALVVGSGTLISLVATSPAGATAVTLRVATNGHDVCTCQITNCLALGYALSQASAASTII